MSTSSLGPPSDELTTIVAEMMGQLSAARPGFDASLAEGVPPSLPLSLVPSASDAVGARGVPTMSPPGLATPAYPSAPPLASSGLNVGAGGVSTGMTAPPVPGFATQAPIAQAPPPKEGDLRALPAMFSELTGVSSPVVLAGLVPAFTAESPFGLGTRASVPNGDAAQGATPYFLNHATLSTPSSTPPLNPLPPVLTSFQGSEAGALPSLALAPSAFSSHQPELDLLRLDPVVVPQVRSAEVFDAETIKRDFPILAERVHGRPLVWLDNAATTQKPRSVIDRVSYYYEHENSNVHRAAHALAARSTDAYEGARDKVRRFLNAPSVQQIVFARGATEAINLVAQSWGRRNVGPGDEILITWLEHHANIVPWQQLCSDRGARLCVAPVDARGQVILEEFEKLLNPKTRIVSFAHVSNALGTILPVRQLVDMAHRAGARVLVDGAQAVSHIPVDVQALDCDFYCFSGHKVFAPTGIGVLYGKAAVLDAMPPWQGGGNMIADVTFEKTAYQGPPYRFEAGTGSIADAVGLGAAIDYVSALGLERINRYEHDLLAYATAKLDAVPGLRMIGTAAEKAGVLSFVLDGVRTEDVGAALDQEGIAVRSGHHCAQPILRRFGLESTVRASLAPYNTPRDIDTLVAALLRIQGGRSSGGSLSTPATSTEHR